MYRESWNHREGMDDKDLKEEFPGEENTSAHKSGRADAVEYCFIVLKTDQDLSQFLISFIFGTANRIAS